MRSKLPIVLLFVVVVGFLGIVYAIGGRAVAVVQPIAFNHNVHVREASLSCTDCHKDVNAHSYAGIPGKTACLECHDIDEEEGTHPEKDRLFRYADTDDDIPWVRVAVTRPDVFFSHRRHVVAADMDCLECHPGQPSLTQPPATVELVMTMTDCIKCHEEKGASIDCLACHR